jgi:hypothetical protein
LEEITETLGLDPPIIPLDGHRVPSILHSMWCYFSRDCPQLVQTVVDK